MWDALCQGFRDNTLENSVGRFLQARVRDKLLGHSAESLCHGQNNWKSCVESFLHPRVRGKLLGHSAICFLPPRLAIKTLG